MKNIKIGGKNIKMQQNERWQSYSMATTRTTILLIFVAAKLANTNFGTRAVVWSNGAIGCFGCII